MLGDPGLLLAGGHTWNMSYNVVHQRRHQDRGRQGGRLRRNATARSPRSTCPDSDYNGDGVIEGVQTEVQHMLDKLSTMLPNSTYQANSNNYVADGLVKTSI